jgi:cbb3-type cytochrome oxidase subunit 3
MIITVLQVIWTVLSLTIFICIVAWAWSKKSKPRFHVAALTPLKDETFEEGRDHG